MHQWSLGDQISLPGILVREGLFKLIVRAGPRQETRKGDVTALTGSSSNRLNSRGYQRQNIYRTSSPLSGVTLTQCIYTYQSFISI